MLNSFTDIRAVYERVWKNMVEPDMPSSEKSIAVIIIIIIIIII